MPQGDVEDHVAGIPATVQTLFQQLVKVFEDDHLEWRVSLTVNFAEQLQHELVRVAFDLLETAVAFGQLEAGILLAQSLNHLQNDGSRGYSKSREWRHVASIPPGIVRAWEMELGVAAGFLETREGLPILLRKVKDPDFKNFRTT